MPSEVLSLKFIGVAYHNLGAAGVGGAPEKSMRYLQMAYDLNPTDNETLAFLGSAITMVARDSWNFFTKLSDVNRGINLLDKAVAKDPDNCVIRLVRGKNAQHLPDFLGRKNLTKQDFLKIEDIVAINFGVLDADIVSDVYYTLGRMYKEEAKLEKANFYFKKSEEMAPNSPSGQLSKKAAKPND